LIRKTDNQDLNVIIAGAAFQVNNACFAKRRDSLRTYHITAISGGELVEIFLQHTISSQCNEVHEIVTILPSFENF